MADVEVSVILITFEHEPFIAQAIESVLAQRTARPFELLISDDGSSDATGTIAREFAKSYPDRVRVFGSNVNLNSNEVTLRALRAARGRYVAFLDGDDYWTSSLKLQGQVDFLDGHPECSMCFHNVMVIQEDGAVAPREFNPPTFPTITELPALLERNFVAGCSAMIRRDALATIPGWYRAASLGDWPLYIFAAQCGSIGYLREVMGAYRVHKGGLWSAASRANQLERLISFYGSIHEHLGQTYCTVVTAVLAARIFELALEHKAAGRHGEAVHCIVDSLRCRLFTPMIRPGRRLWHLLWAVMAALTCRSRLRLTRAKESTL